MTTATCIVRRWWSKLDFDNPHGCWLWTANQGADGYGKIGSAIGDGRVAQTYAHHLAYELFIGVRPGGNLHTINHTCGNPPCCNPAHLELVEHRSNTRSKDHDLETFDVDCGISACFRCKVLHRAEVRPAPERTSGGAGKRRKVCTIPQCGRTHHARGLCSVHYRRWLLKEREAEARAYIHTGKWSA